MALGCHQAGLSVKCLGGLLAVSATWRVSSIYWGGTGDPGISASLYDRCNAAGSRLVLGLEWDPVCAARRLTRQRECLTGALNIRQVTHSPAPAYISYTSHTPHSCLLTLSMTRQVALHCSPQLIPSLWEQHNGPALIRPQRWGGYISPADTIPLPHKARQGQWGMECHTEDTAIERENSHFRRPHSVI